MIDWLKEAWSVVKAWAVILATLIYMIVYSLIFGKWPGR
jgi:hypothetical protein